VAATAVDLACRKANAHDDFWRHGTFIGATTHTICAEIFTRHS
jgi:hypothetical protein